MKMSMQQTLHLRKTGNQRVLKKGTAKTNPMMLLLQG